MAGLTPVSNVAAWWCSLADRLGDLSRDVQHAARGLRRSPAFTLAVVVMLGLGSGAATAVFGVVYGLLDPDGAGSPNRGLDCLVATFSGLGRLRRGSSSVSHPMDMPTVAAVTLVVVGVAWVAAYLPARQATRIDPMDVLRTE